MSTASFRPVDLVVSGQRVELQLTSISACTLRVSLLPIAVDGSLQPAANIVRTSFGCFFILRRYQSPLWIDDLRQCGARAVIGGIAAVRRPDSVRACRETANGRTSRPGCGPAFLGECHGSALADRVCSIGERDSSGWRVAGVAR